MTALAASIAPRQPVDSENRREATATPAPAGTPTLVTVEQEIATTADTRVTADEGNLVELTVTGSTADSVMLLGRMETVHPDSPARFSVYADKPGEYPIELVEAERRIGTLVVREAS